jgi:hypothetical protein
MPDSNVLGALTDYHVIFEVGTSIPVNGYIEVDLGTSFNFTGKTLTCTPIKNIRTTTVASVRLSCNPKPLFGNIV